jgi:hypothetical protein
MTTAERTARHDQQRKLIAAGIAALQQSDGWKRWLTTRRRFHHYSFGNQILIASQCPHSTHVAGFKAWLKLDRCVRKGEHAIKIIAPCAITKTDDDGENHDTIVAWRLASVFDVSQVDPLPGRDPAPLDPPTPAPITGDSHGRYWASLVTYAGTLGYTVTREPADALHGAEGYCNATDRRIVVCSDVPPNAAVRILVHEIAHAHGVGYTEYGRNAAEVLVDTVTFMVCDTIGLGVSGAVIPYVASWGDANAAKTIETFAKTIDLIARQIEHAVDA